MWSVVLVTLLSFLNLPTDHQNCTILFIKFICGQNWLDASKYGLYRYITILEGQKSSDLGLIPSYLQIRTPARVHARSDRSAFRFQRVCLPPTLEHNAFETNLV
jgi:hypothetical protein